MNWIKINEVSQLDEISKDSENQAAVIFKHSTTCSISATALDRFERNWAKSDQSADIKYYYLDLLKHRDISKAIADKFDVQHESPQMILLKKGEVVFHESHYGINFEETLAKI